MFLKSSLSLSVIACSSLVFGACGLGEIGAPKGPPGLDSDGDGVVDAVDPNPFVASPDDARNAGGAAGANSDNSDGATPGAGSPGSVNSDPAVSSEALSFRCDPEARATKTLQRLSRRELENTLRDVLTRSTSAATASSVMEAVSAQVATYPAEVPGKNTPFSVMDQTVSQAHVDALLRIGDALGKALTATPDRVSELVGSCAGTSCIDTFIATFGKRVLRHELNAAERTFYKDVYGSASSAVDAAALSDVIAVMFNAPDFLYRVEYGADAVSSDGSLVKLNDYEIATRLSYHFWQSAPDDELIAAADRGELSTDAGFQAALDRVLDDPRAAEGLERFTREWLSLDSLRPLDTLVGTPVFDKFAGADVPTPELREEMIQDVTDSIAYHAFQDEGTLAEWLESPYSFAKSQDLAAIYNTPAWDGASEPPRFPAGQRAGLVTRAALLATGSANTRPIMKGILIRERLLCDHLAPPPPNAASELPDLSGDKTTRELVETVTEAPNTSCAGCHTKQINPLGFATEGFDALGRMREKQDLFDDKGNIIASKPVNTTSIPRVWTTDETPSSGPADLTSLLVDSGKVEACFAREWVRYAEARTENEDIDGCQLETVRKTLSDGESIREALRRSALLPQFRQRYLPAGS